jgi:replicative DNA helicase
MKKLFKKPIGIQGPDDLTRSLPYSNDGERGVLSCFLSDPTLLVDFGQSMTSEAFHHPAHRLIYETMRLFTEKCWPVEYIALSQYLQDNGLIERIGGNGMLAELLDFSPTTAHYGYYKGILRDKYLLRQIIGACTEGISFAHEYQEDVPGLLNKVALRISEVTKEASGMIVTKTWKDEVDEFEAEWTKAYLKKVATAIPTRWSEWNSHFGGLRPEFHVIKGKTSRGKTSMALNLLKTVGVDQGKPCLWFPYEMSKHSLICRLIADEAQVDSRCLFSPDTFPPTKEERNKISAAKNKVMDAPIELVKQRNMDASFIVNQCLAFAGKHGEVGLIGIDYLQKIAHPEWSGRNDNSSDRLTYNCGQCFNVQQEIGCAMLMISSTNQEGGTLGSQSADYDTDIAIEVDRDHGFKVPKNRNGATHKDWIPLKFNGRFVRFESTSEHEDNIP